MLTSIISYLILAAAMLGPQWHLVAPKAASDQCQAETVGSHVPAHSNTFVLSYLVFEVVEEAKLAARAQECLTAQ